MATAVAKKGEAIPFTEAEIEYNKRVDELANNLRTIASDVVEDMKLRQLPLGLKGDKVYGKESPNRSTLKTMGSRIKKVADKVVVKLRKGGATKAKANFIGFAVPAYINRDLAMALGLRESQPGQQQNVLWPHGGKPIFSSGLITKFFTHYVMANGLIHADDLTKFSSSEMMKTLFTPYVVSSVKQGDPPIDLNNLNYTDIQKLTKNFIEAGSKPHIDPEKGTAEERENAKKLIAVFDALGEQFKELGLLKKKVEEAILAEARAKSDVVKADACYRAGQITVDLFNSYAQSYTELSRAREQIFQFYHGKAKAMGI